MQWQSPAHTVLSDAELIDEVKRLATREREATAALVVSLAEFDARKLYLAAGYSSLFVYCVHVLGLSEDAAYFRIEAARAGRKFPLVLERLADGAITLTAVKLLAPHLTTANHRALLDEARGRTKREVELIVARVQPSPDVASLVRKLPASASHECSRTTQDAKASALSGLVAPLAESADRGARDETRSANNTSPAGTLALTGSTAATLCDSVFTCASPPRRAVIAPSAPERYKIQMTVSAGTHAKLRRAQDLLRHALPDGDPAVIFDRALTVLLEQLERRKCAAKKRRPGMAANGSGVASRPDADSPANKTAGRPQGGGRNGSDVATTPRAAAPPAGMSDEESPKLVPERPRVPKSRKRSGARTRYIPAAIKRAVWARDDGRCAFVRPDGTRCGATAFLEYHHLVPYADGGATTVENLRLTCKGHNAREAERWFGDG